MRLTLVLIHLAFGFLLSIPASAYPTFIRHEYKSCTSCHWNPRGGGLLTDYGQGIAGGMSAFPVDYQGPPDTSWYRALTADKAITHGLNSRIMRVVKEGRQPSTFPMQFDYLNGTKFSKNLRFEGALGIHARRDATGSVIWNGSLFDVLTLRQAMLTWAPVDGREWTVGRDYLPVGLNIDDHNALIRTKNRRGVVDYPTQLRLDRWTEASHFTPFLFGPSGEESIPNREYGLGTRAEFYPTAKSAVGGTLLFGRSSTVSRELVNVFTRWSPISMLALLFEYDFTLRQPLSQGGTPSFGQHVFYFKPSFEFLEWMDVGPIAEFETRASPFSEKVFRYGVDSYFRVMRQFSVLLMSRVTHVQGGNSEKMIALQLFAHL